MFERWDVKWHRELQVLLVALLVYMLLAPITASAQAPASKGGRAVRIGLLAPGKGAGMMEGKEIRKAAELAVEQANQAGGYQGKPFELVVRSDEGLWGAGSTEIMKLVFEDSVWAIMGSVDGRSAHLAEQIVTKGRIAFLTPWASDPSTTRINVPWFFRSVPDDYQQAEVLVKEIFGTGKSGRVVSIRDGGYDATHAENAFFRTVEKEGKRLSGRILLEGGREGLREAAEMVHRASPQSVVLFLLPEKASALVRVLREKSAQTSVFGPLSLNVDAFARAPEGIPGKLYILAPEEGSGFSGFSMLYRKAYGKLPGVPAAYAYDGMNAIIHAIRKAGLNHRQIRDALADISIEAAVTGKFRFDARGNRKGAPVLAQVEKGRSLPNPEP